LQGEVEMAIASHS